MHPGARRQAGTGDEVARTGSVTVPRMLAAFAVVAVLTAVTAPARAASSLPGQAAPTVTSGVDYGGGRDGSLLLDVYEPAGTAASRPAVVLVHGGGWTSGDRTEVAPDATAFAEAGMVAFAIDYDLDGPNRWPDQLGDVQTAVRWVQANAATYRVDASRVGLFGSSAGGNLAMLAATRGLGDPAAPPVKVVVTWSGPTDLTTLAPTNVESTQLTGAPGTIAGADIPSGCEGDPECLGVLDPQAFQAYLGCTIDVCPQTFVDASPVFGVVSSTPPMLLVNAQTDLVPAEQSYEMVNALSAAGVANAILLVAGEGHADSYRDTALAPTTAFLTRYLIDGADPRTPTTTPPSTIAGSQALPPLGADNRLPTSAPPPAVQAVLDPATAPLLPVAIGGAVLVLVVAAIVVIVRRRR